MPLAENDPECLDKIIPQDKLTVPIYAKVKKGGKIKSDQGSQNESKKSDGREGGSEKGDQREGGSGKGDRREGGSGKGNKKAEGESRKRNGEDGSRKKHVQKRDDGIHFEINTGPMKSKHVTPKYPVTNNQRLTRHSTNIVSTPMEEDSSESCSMSEELPEFDSDEEDYHTTPITHSSSFPSHRPPPKPSPRQQGSSSQCSRPSNTQSSLKGLANLPVYSLNQSMSLASGDQAYLLTRARPDGSMEHFTATVLSPVVSPSPPFYHPGSSSPFPQEPIMHTSRSIPSITTSTPMRDKPLSRSQSVHQSVLPPSTGYDFSLSATKPLSTSHPNVSSHSPSLDQSKNHIPGGPDIPEVSTKQKHVHREQGWFDTLQANSGPKIHQSSYTDKTTAIDNSEFIDLLLVCFHSKFYLYNSRFA